jgi:hypothetical protein
VAQYVLPKTKSVSTYKAYQWPTDTYLTAWFDFSMRHRALLWAPWIGLALIAMGCRRLWTERRAAHAVITGTYALQLAAVFAFSIAGEYRYLLAFFTAPLALLPVLFHQPQHDDV